MKLIKINKTLLILAFFMPFTVTMCSRSENLHFGKPSEEVGSKIMTHQSSPINYFSYLLYPTEYSASGFGFTYNAFHDVVVGRFKFEVFKLIPLAFICSIFGLILTFYQKRRMMFYLSLMNLTCFLVFAIIAVGSSLFDNSLEDLFDILLWGFWLAIILSMIDIYLTKRNTYS